MKSLHFTSFNIMALNFPESSYLKATWHGSAPTTVRIAPADGQKVEVKPNETVEVHPMIAERLKREYQWEVEAQDDGKYQGLNTERNTPVAPNKRESKAAKKAREAAEKEAEEKRKKEQEDADKANQKQTADERRAALTAMDDEALQKELDDAGIVHEGSKEEKIEALMEDFDEGEAK